MGGLGKPDSSRLTRGRLTEDLVVVSLDLLRIRVHLAQVPLPTDGITPLHVYTEHAAGCLNMAARGKGS